MRGNRQKLTSGLWYTTNENRTGKINICFCFVFHQKNRRGKIFFFTSFEVGHASSHFVPVKLNFYQQQGVHFKVQFVPCEFDNKALNFIFDWRRIGDKTTINDLCPQKHLRVLILHTTKCWHKTVTTLLIGKSAKCVYSNQKQFS